MSLPTILDMAVHNAPDGVSGLIDEATRATPEVRFGAARTIKHRMYPTVVRTAVPRGGSMRGLNQGVKSSKSVYENRLVQTYIINPRWECDKAAAEGHPDGAEAYITLEASGIMEGAMQDLGQQFYYGNHATFGISDGVPGLLQSYDAENMDVDAKGTTADKGSSVWLVKFGPADVQWVWGMDGSMTMEPVRIESIVPDADKPDYRMTAFVQELLAYPGIQVASRFSVVRIKNLTEEAGHGLTDSIINEALERFPVGKQPDFIFCSQRSRQQLRDSRTATTTTGAPASPITTIPGLGGEDIPVYATASLRNDEPINLAA